MKLLGKLSILVEKVEHGGGAFSWENESIIYKGLTLSQVEFKFFFPEIGWNLNLTADIFFVHKTDNTAVMLLRKKKKWLLPLDFPHTNRLHCRANALHRIMSLQDFYSHKKHLQCLPNIQTITEGKYLGGGVLHESDRNILLKFWKESLNEINLGVAQDCLDLKRYLYISSCVDLNKTIIANILGLLPGTP